MNFLAHLWLADRTQTSLAGSVLGDVVRGADLSAYPPDIALGIRLHRRVDATTDRHPAMVEARSRFAPGARRYAGIVLDLAADHALATAWPRLHSEPLAPFAQRCGSAMAAAAPWFVLGGSRRPDAQGFAELLQSYATPSGIVLAVRRVATRLRDPQGLIDASTRWPEVSATLDAQLEPLLQDLIAAMRRPV